MTFDEWWNEIGKKWDPSGQAEGVVAMAWDAATAVEREACAKVCEELSFTPQGPSYEAKRQRLLCATAIRARSDTNGGEA